MLAEGLDTAAVIRRLESVCRQETPLRQDHRDPNTYLKFEGGGMIYGHKFRSAAYLLIKALSAGQRVSHVADRSSGSWAMGLAWAARVAGATSSFVTVGDPHPYIRQFVESVGGCFHVVDNNAARLAKLDELRSSGIWVPDQHNNVAVIEAFEKSLGPELARQFREHQLAPDYLVAPVGTGGLLAGCARYLRAHGAKLTTVGVDLSSSLVHEGTRHFKYPHAKVRGVGSDDEYCETLITSREQIDRIVPQSPFQAWKEMLALVQEFPCSVGMSGGLALAAASQLRREVGPDKKIVVILPDRGETYAEELRAARLVFGRAPLRFQEGA
ncbi:pyridoxal-phosphate dependent enzyme [Archangium minus]|uniref:Pyridoxal-phosphate dependent enzyme n=1 Tax=Archangium minus TaxID=83450 RepID=A0ABY9WW60_9BACT|nr:pyridoxal-phosphate dependent enzyme [Archangium minus]